MPKPIDIRKLSSVQRGYLLGVRRARARLRRELSSTAADLDADLAIAIEETPADACVDVRSNEEEV